MNFKDRDDLLKCCKLFLTGKALKFVRDKVLTFENGMRRSVPKVLVVVTDGRSQDDVKKSAKDIQHSGMFSLEIN